MPRKANIGWAIKLPIPEKMIALINGLAFSLYCKNAIVATGKRVKSKVKKAQPQHYLINVQPSW